MRPQRTNSSMEGRHNINSIIFQLASLLFLGIASAISLQVSREYMYNIGLYFCIISLQSEVLYKAQPSERLW
jgi:hypothetical protein